MAYFGSIRSIPFMNGRRTSGTVTLPSSFWKFSKSGMRIRGEATAVLFNVWQYLVFPSLPRYLILSLLA